MNNPLTGLTYFLDGFSLITKPGIKRFVIIPFCINLLLFLGLFFLLRHYMSAFNNWVTHFLPSWLHWLAIILWFIFFIAFMLIFIYTFVTIANLIAAPFNSLLAEKVEIYLTGKTVPSRSLFENVKDTPRIVMRQLAIIGYYLPRALLLLILFFIPIIHVFAAILWFLLNAWFMTLTYLDYPSDNHQIPINTVKELMSEKKWLALGFGMSTLIATMIPIINFVAIPAAVAGATKLWVQTYPTKKIK